MKDEAIICPHCNGPLEIIRDGALCKWCNRVYEIVKNENVTKLKPTSAAHWASINVMRSKAI